MRGARSSQSSKSFTMHAGGISLVLAVVATAYLMAIQPIKQRTSELQVEEQRLQAMVASTDAVNRSIAAQQKHSDATTAQLRRLLARLPDQPQVDRLMAALSGLAGQSNAEVVSLHPVATTSGEIAAIQTVKLRLKCDHAGLCRFLASLNSSPVTVWPAAVELRSENTGESLGRGQWESGGGIRHADITLLIPHAGQQTVAGQAKQDPMLNTEA